MSLFFAATASFLLCLLLTPPVRRLARPLAARREQPGRAAGAAVPRLGGLAVWGATAAALALTFWMRFPVSNDLVRRTQLTALAGPLLLVVILGAVDDWYGLSASYKFAVQGAAALWVAASGVRVTELFFHPLPLPLSVGVTVLWLVGCSNAFNLIDGLDGLATGLALFADVTLLAHAVLSNQPGLALLSATLFGALAAFLLFNFPPASVYLGDTGSLSIGFFLGSLALLWIDKATTAIGLVAPLFALLVPMTDTVVAIFRRGLAGQPLFSADHQHLHHRLLQRGMKPRTVTLALYGIAIAGAVLALMLQDVRRRETAGLVVLLFVALAAFGIHQLGYVEFAQAGRMFRRGVFEHTKVIQAHVALQRWCDTVAAAGDFSRIGEGLRGLGEELNFTAVELRVGSAGAAHWIRRYDCFPALHDGDGPALDAFAGWSLEVPLGAAGELGAVRFWCASNAGNPVFMHELAAAVTGALSPRLLQLLAAPTRGAVTGL